MLWVQQGSGRDPENLGIRTPLGADLGEGRAVSAGELCPPVTLILEMFPSFVWPKADRLGR